MHCFISAGSSPGFCIGLTTLQYICRGFFHSDSVVKNAMDSCLLRRFRWVACFSIRFGTKKLAFVLSDASEEMHIKGPIWVLFPLRSSWESSCLDNRLHAGSICLVYPKKLVYRILRANQIVSDFLPMLRLRLRTFRPPVVFMRDLNPWVRARLTLLGW